MFRNFNITNKPDFKAELCKNRREVIADITDYITSINYKLDDIDTIEITINKYIMRNGIKKENVTYKQIKDKMLVDVALDGKKSRYFLKENTRNIDRNSGVKKFTAYSFQKTLENKRVEFHTVGESYPLVNDGSKDGVLDLACKKSGWKVGYVDELAKSEFIYSAVTKTEIMARTIIKNNIQHGDLLWECPVNISTYYSEVPLRATIQHKNLARFDSYGDELVKNETYDTVLDPLQDGIKNIKAYYNSQAGNRYGIKFEITLLSGTVVTQIKEFTNLKDLTMSCESINIIYETGAFTNQLQTKYVWLESIDTDILKFLSDMQNEFRVLFVYDTYNQIINCYSKDNMNDEAPVQLSYDSNILKIDTKPVEEAITAVRVVGGENVSIISTNKYGSDIIYNYSYFVNNNLISDELLTSLEKYESYLDEVQEKWNVLNERKRLFSENKIKIECEIKTLNERIKTVNELLSAYIAAGNNSDRQAEIRAELTELEKLFNENMAMKDTVNVAISLIDVEIENISKCTNRDTCGLFTEEDLLELNDIDIVEVFSNDVATTSESLYSSAEWYLNERTKPGVEFNISCANLLKIIKNENIFDNVITLGRLFELDTDIATEIGEDKVRLSEFTYIPSENSITNIKFTNKVFKVDKLEMAKKIQKRAISSILDTKAYKSSWQESTNVNSFVNNLSSNGINISDMTMKTNQLYSIIPEPVIEDDSEESEVYSIDEDIVEISAESDIEQSSAGIFIKDRNNPNKQLYLGSGIMAFSSDGFKTSSISVDEGGVKGKSIYGEILLGKKLYIKSDDEEETFYIGSIEETNGFGMRITDTRTGEERVFLGTEPDENGFRQAKLRLTSEDGQSAITESGLVNVYSFVYNDDLDANHPLEFSYPVDIGTHEIRSCTLSLFLQKYRMSVKSLSAGGQISTTTTNGNQLSATAEAVSTVSYTAMAGYYGEIIETLENTIAENIHKHFVEMNILDHSHMVELPSHWHTFTVDSHSHTFDTTHEHELIAGIFESTTPANCSLYVNDVLVMANINYDTVVDIKEYLLIGSANTIKITSESLGRIQLNILNKSFIKY